jgi:hypothetical protein
MQLPSIMKRVIFGFRLSPLRKMGLPENSFTENTMLEIPAFLGL